MINESDVLEKQLKVINYFLDNPTSSILEISDKTGVSKSSCQRYLTLPQYSNIIIEKTGRTISEQLKFNKLMGNRKGGRTTFNTFAAKKDESGKFVGLIKEPTRINAEENKQKDIIKIVTYFSKNSYSTLDQIACFFDNIYTHDYIYDCLNDPRVEEIFGMDIASAITQQLSNNNYGILKKYQGVWDENLFKSAGLSEQEISILLYRFSNGQIRSAEDTAHNFGISKTRVNVIENSAIKKIEEYQKEVKKK